MVNRNRVGQGLILATFLFFLLAGCVPQKVTTGAFTKTGGLDTELQKGVSTKMDVQRVLGAPDGFGGSVLPTDPRPREVWYYGDIEGTDIKMEEGIWTMILRQQILLIFFEKGVFDGYLWSTNAGEGEFQY